MSDKPRRPPRRSDGPPRREGGPPRRGDGPPRREGSAPRRSDGPPRREGGPPRRSDGPPRREGDQRREGGATRSMPGRTQPYLDRCRFIAMASRGTESILRGELETLGMKGLEVVPGGVIFEGPIVDGMRAALWSRVAMRVLLELGRGVVHTPRDLYAMVRSCPLEAYFDSRSTLAVFATANRAPEFKNSQFASLKVKDAIVDAMRERYGFRPDIAARDPDISVVLHLHETDARLYLDLAGKPLNQRGFRSKTVDAPVKENIAAALLLYSGWDARQPLHDPTCGGGTIVMEAAQMALDWAPALGRPMTLERWPIFERHLQESWTALQEEAKQRKRPSLRGVIKASDSSRDSVTATRTNLAVAKLLDDVSVRQADARKIEPLLGGGYIVFNPPYGERIGGDTSEVEKLYHQMAERMLGFADHTVALISTRELLREGFGGAEPNRSVDVLNGKIDCRISVFVQ